MDKQSDTSDTVNIFELEIIKRRLTDSVFMSLFQRVSNILQSAVAVHIWDLNTAQNFLVWSNKKFSLCSSVLKNQVGFQKCFLDRYGNAKKVIHLDTPLFYKCHAGFSCGIIHLLQDKHFNLVLTIGPFYIEESIDILQFNVVGNLRGIGLYLSKEEEELLKSLSRYPIESIRDILLWTKESFQSLWNNLLQNEKEVKVIFEKSKNKVEKRQGKAELILQYYEIFDKDRIRVFLVSVRMKNKKLMEFILMGKGEEINIQKRNLKETKVSLYLWVMNIINSFLVGDNKKDFMISEGLMTVKEHLFSDSKPLKSFIKSLTRIVFSSIDENFIEKENKTEKFSIFFNILEKKLITGPLLLSVSEEMGLEPSALSHWIKRNTGINYEEFLTYIQTEKVAELLRNTDKNLSEIGVCVGIQYSSLVSEKFKRITGLYPTEYKAYFMNRLKKH